MEVPIDLFQRNPDGSFNFDSEHTVDILTGGKVDLLDKYTIGFLAEITVLMKQISVQCRFFLFILDLSKVN